MIRKCIGAALLALSLVSAGAASAKEDIMVVRVSDLNTSGHRGAEIALRRIRHAALQFCGEANIQDLSRTFEQRRCVATMVSRAVNTLNEPMVTALYNPDASIQLASRTAR